MVIKNPTNELLGQQFAMEFIGTFFFVAVILTVTNPENGVSAGIAPIAIGFALIAAIYFAGFNTGGAFNPAVTLALTMNNNYTWFQFLVYITAQLTAAAIVYIFWKYVLNSHNVKNN